MFYKNFQQPARLKRSLVQDLKPVSEGLGKRMMDEASDFSLKSGILCRFIAHVARWAF